MLRVVHSNRSAALAEALAEAIGPRPDPFAPVRVVVAGRLVERWLMRQLAQRHGIAAGIDWQSFEAMLVGAYAGDEAGRASRIYAIDRSSLPLALASVLAGVSRRPAAERIGEGIDAGGGGKLATVLDAGASLFPVAGAPSTESVASVLELATGLRREPGASAAEAAGARSPESSFDRSPERSFDRSFGEALGPVRAYLASDDPLDVARRVQLADRLADLYWSYGLSRPQWLMAWQRRQPIAELPSGDGAATWQGELWARLIEHVTSSGGSAVGEASGREGRRRRSGGRWAIPPLLPALRRELGLPPPRVGKLSVIGFPYLTRAYLDALTDLGSTSDITLYLMNPCQELWEDVGAGQLGNEPAPLVLWGRPIRDTVSALIERTSGDFEDRFVDPTEELPPGARAPTALAQLLGDVLRRTSRESGRWAMGRGVRPGVTILDCPSIRRELEVIGSEILRLLAADPSLSAHQIAVLVAGRDANSYLEQAAAALAAVGPVPCHLIEAPLAESGRIVDGLVALLELPSSKMTRRDLLRVMTHPAVIARYPHADADQWVRWTERLGVAHGADAESHRHTYLAEHRELFHWDQGVRRLAMGAFMVGERAERGPAKIGERLLIPEELRADAHASAATFALLARSLISDTTWMRSATRSLTGWSEALTALVDAYLEPIDDSAVHELERARRILSQLADHDLDGRVIAFPEVRELVLRRLAGLTTDRGEALAAGVTVAPLSAFRAIPFRHVFIAGLGDGDFPASEGRHPLDLRNDVRFGDVSPRERDRHTFFEAVLAATDGLWLSYVGLHPKSGDRTGPSSVIVELADAIAPYVGAASGGEALSMLTATHPLHRFDRRYAEAERAVRRAEARGELRAPGALTSSTAPGTPRELWARQVREELVEHLRAKGSPVPDEDRLLQVLSAAEVPALVSLAEDIGIVASGPDGVARLARGWGAPAAPPEPASAVRFAAESTAGAEGAAGERRGLDGREGRAASAEAGSVVSEAPAEGSGPAAAQEPSGPARAASRSAPKPARSLGISTLRDFLEFPVQAWAHAVLGLEEVPDEILLEKSDEPFAVGPAERAVLLREVMAAHLRDPSVPLRELYEQQVTTRRLRSKFPVGVFGRAVAHGDMEVLEVWRAALGPLPVTGSAAVIRHGFGRAFAPHTQLHDAVELSIELNGEPHNVRLIGQTEMIVARHGSVIFKTGKMAEREHLRGAFDNVVLAAAELSVDGHAHLVIDGEGASRRVTHAPWTPSEARAYLTSLAQDLFGQPHGYVLSLVQMRDALRGRLGRQARTTGNRRDDQRVLGYGPITRGDGLGAPPSVEELARRRLLPLVERMDGDHPFKVNE